MDRFVGKVLGNRYELIEKIGEGGMALVYRAKCQLLNRYVAVKILKPEFVTDEDFINEFGSLKPCIHGSDAHSFERLCKPDEDRFCWIKADPSFEGLKHTVYEPDERVYDHRLQDSF